MTKYNEVADEATITTTLEALKANNFEAQVVEDFRGC